MDDAETDSVSEVDAAPLEGRKDEVLSVRSWRFDYACRLGFRPLDAYTVAQEATDLHEVEGLIRRGCERELALRIVR
ncbi:MAG TPA: hypothetical protein VE088_03200 [Gaiellaceae bacterium]|jgi:hypothetical protein|nr:hypothetical protein [Gaiellaceae bacterium]